MFLILTLAAAIEVRPVFYTNHNYWFDLRVRSDIMYGATNGGLVRYDPALDEYRVLTDADGLPMNRLNCVGIDSSGYVWAGTEAGIALADPAMQNILTYPLDCLPCSRVYAAACLRDTVFFGTAAGLLRIETRGTPNDFNDDIRTEIFDIHGLPSNNITAIAVGSSIWIGTDAGLARCSKDFQQIDTFSTAHGLLDNAVTCLLVEDTLVLVGTDRGLNRLHAGRFDTLVANLPVADAALSHDTILLALDTVPQIAVFVLTDSNLSYVTTGLPGATTVNCVAHAGSEWAAGLGNAFGTTLFGEGLGMCDLTLPSPAWTMHAADCLPSNHISDVCVNDSGVFLALGVRSNNQLSQGIGWLRNDGRWEHYTAGTALSSNQIHRCEAGPDGRVWFGLNPISNSGMDTVLAYSFDPAADQWWFLPVGFQSMESTDALWDIKLDPGGNLYMEIGRPSDRLWVISAGLDTVRSLVPKQDGFFNEIALDTLGRIWRTITDPGGVVMTDTRHSLFYTNDDTYRIYSTSEGLASPNTRGCVTGADDRLYVVTVAGLAAQSGDGFTMIPGLPEAELYDVARDSEGRIWILSSIGVHYYDPEHAYIGGWQYSDLGISLNFYSLLKEIVQIQAFTFDALRHCFWLAGDNGLLKLEITGADSLPLDSITVYPNPSLSGRTIRIKNLPADSRVSIYSIAGRRLAKDLLPDASFNEVVWNIPEGTASGLYFALIVSDRGKKIAKFAIAR